MTSMPQASNGKSKAPSALMASTTRMAGLFCATLASAWMGWATPVDDSFACTKTPFASGLSSSAFSTAAGSTGEPHAHLSVTALTPYALANFAHLSPNLPPSMTMTVSPLRRKFVNAASIAPVPLEANWITSSLVWKSHWSPSRTRAKTCSNSGER